MNKKIFKFFLVFFLTFQTESFATNPSDFVQSAVNKASEILKQNISKNEKMDNSVSNFKAEGVIPINRALYGVKYKSKTWYKNIGDHFIDDIFYLYFNVTSHIP